MRVHSMNIPARASGNLAFIAPGIAQQSRSAIEDAIEYLIGLLDNFDPDPDLEPSLGWNERGDVTTASNDECETDHDFELSDIPPDVALADFLKRTGGRHHV